MMQTFDGPAQQLSDDNRLRQIVTASADGIIVVDGEGRVCFLNPAAANILGRSANELLGQFFGYPVLGGERAEIDLLHPDGQSQVAEMRVVDTEWGGAPAQLISLRDITEHRRAHQALRDAEAFNWAILNSLSVHLAVLDARGTIIAVNDAWRDFARANGDPELRLTGVGVNYFTVCQHASGKWSEEVPDVLEGMRAVLEGRLPTFELEYPCHAPHEERWFVLRVVPLRGQRSGLVISHADVTAQRQMAHAAAEAAMLRERLQTLERELVDVDLMSQHESGLPRRVNSTPLRQRLPAAFTAAVENYRQLLDLALLRQRGVPDVSPESGLRSLGDRLGRQGATPRDVVEIHLSGVRVAGANAPSVKQQAYLEEGRLMVLELMGYLAGYYRGRTLGLSGETSEDDMGMV
jgi:PAS domain-containing protein